MKDPFRSGITLISVLLAVITCGCQQQQLWRLSKETYLDKCKGAWAGQMIGVCYSAPYEFKYAGKIMEDPTEPWRPERIAGAMGQDDCYVEMTWLTALEKHGLDITYTQAGRAFADTKYGLAHANKYGRANCRKGIMPPLSGHPKYNRHADDIDFQIEADLLGIICPGMPLESNRLCDVFGHIMNYGDGVYGGTFVAGMYTAAYMESDDIVKVIRAGLKCIPSQSLYHQCISDVLKWYAQNPNDWRATWQKIEDKWQDDIDCWPFNPYNIDAKLNGAYIVVGLLYGKGDFADTLEISTRCGQDNDCNVSSAAGVLGCMKGYAALGENWTGGIADVENINFAHTDYSFKTLIPACQRMTERIIQRIGGKVSKDAYIIPRQQPQAPKKLEQWTDQMEILGNALPKEDVQKWNPAWQVTACGMVRDPGVKEEALGRTNVLTVHPVSRMRPAILAARLDVPAGKPKMHIELASHEKGNYQIRLFVNNQLQREMKVDTKGQWQTVIVDLQALAGKTVDVRAEIYADGWTWATAYIDRIVIK